MELNEIRYFLALSRVLNFTKAAEVCNVSQPALTRAIRKMEDTLGGLLFARERNNTHLTELGQLILPHLAEIIARAGAAEQTAARFLKLEQAHLSVGVMCTIAPMQFVGFLGRFRADNPGVEITLREAVPEKLCDMLVKGELDVALMARPEGFQAPFQATKLYSERFVVACSAGHRFASRPAVLMSELDGEFYFSRINCEFNDTLGEMVRDQGINLLRSYGSEREDWILTMVAAGLGVCFLPEYTATFPGVIGCPVVAPSVQREICLVTMAGRRASPPVKAFAGAVQHYSWPAPRGIGPVSVVG
ncbi:MAG TPA: LysR family transcriptional regulator [Aliidongia sp.]|uniref:LysR family transcriptional regulator n=1 Tax=Aliidongia sp. TaxID=1914230 RepID=UPI002DDCC7CB|nr:LysR family transcriptional regulator [Aliidongia sp.]HEV2673019.1 LysR family transcriptional regulator [Aliidongia sp.]